MREELNSYIRGRRMRHTQLCLELDSCQHFVQELLIAYEHLARDDVGLVEQMSDNINESAGVERVRKSAIREIG